MVLNLGNRFPIKAKEAYELWAQVYPRDVGPLNNLGVVYWSIGQYDNALAAIRKAHDLKPDALTYNNLANCYILLNRLDEARATLVAAPRPDPLFSYRLAFLRNDAAGMAQASSPDGEMLLDSEADTAAYSGRLKKAREFLRACKSHRTPLGAQQSLRSVEGEQLSIATAQSANRTL